MLLLVCTIGNYAWLMHIDSGWGSEGALLMFQFAFFFGLSSIVVSVYRRWRYPDLLPADSDDDDSDEEFDKEKKKLMHSMEGDKVMMGDGRDRRATTVGDVRKKDKSVRELTAAFKETGGAAGGLLKRRIGEGAEDDKKSR